MKTESTDYKTLFDDGNRHLSAGDRGRAEDCFRAVLRIAPDCAEAHANLGLVLEQRGADDESEACYRRSIALDWRRAETQMNLGVFLARGKRFDEAEAAYLRATVLNPHVATAWSNLGVLYACMKRDADAEHCYHTAIRLDGNYAVARFNLSYLQLRQGRFAEGWQSLEARDWYAGLAARMPCPRWRGEPLAGKSLLIGFEAGHGDMIQFGRYASVLKAQGASRIAMLCHPALKNLFATIDGVDEVSGFDEPLPESTWNYWTPPLSIPLYCNTRIDTIPARIPYLHALPERVARVGRGIAPGGLRVGLVWKGSTQFENDADRSIPGLDVLASLGTVAGVKFYSLQKGAGEGEAARPPAELPVTDLAPMIGDFADTAAIVHNLDLVISVDTAVAHLAGALGKPCWVMLPHYKPDWRWLAGRADSPWYPQCMRLFRQPAMGEWSAVVDEVRAALEQFADGHSRNPTPAAHRRPAEVRPAHDGSASTIYF